MNRLEEKQRARMRRHHQKRIKQRWIRRFKDTWDKYVLRFRESYRGGPNRTFFSEDCHYIGIFSTTPQRCSCTKCGNPRRHFHQRTLQEQRADAELETLRRLYNLPL